MTGVGKQARYLILGHEMSYVCDRTWRWDGPGGDVYGIVGAVRRIGSDDVGWRGHVITKNCYFSTRRLVPSPELALQDLEDMVRDEIPALLDRATQARVVVCEEGPVRVRVKKKARPVIQREAPAKRKRIKVREDREHGSGGFGLF